MMTHITTIESTLKAKPQSPELTQRYFKLCLSYIEFISPAEINLETGRMMKLLCHYPLGLKREEMLNLFYEDYATSSFNRQNSLKTCLEKIIQRARVNFEKYQLTIFYCKESKKYYLHLI